MNKFILMLAFFGAFNANAQESLQDRVQKLEESVASLKRRLNKVEHGSESSAKVYCNCDASGYYGHRSDVQGRRLNLYRIDGTNYDLFVKTLLDVFPTNKDYGSPTDDALSKCTAAMSATPICNQ